MSATAYPADAWGGTQADAYGGGVASLRSLHPSTAEWSQAVWDDTEIPDQQFCMAQSSYTEMQCRAYKAKGTEYCIFHLRKFQREQAAQDGVDSSGD